MDKFNDETTAKEAIASSPEVTAGVLDDFDDGEENTEAKAVHKAVNLSPSPEDERNARLASLCAKQCASVCGAEVGDDQLDATREITAEAFAGLSALNPPKWFSLAITFSLLIGSFAPVVVAALNSMKEVKKNGIS